MLGIWAATLGLPGSGMRSFLVTDELLLVALALLDRLAPKGFVLKRLSSPARTFLSMNAAALLALGVFIVKPATLWSPTEVRVRH